MIQSKDDLKEYIQSDKKRNHYATKLYFKYLFLKKDKFYVIRYLKNLRKLEYFSNYRKNLIKKGLYIYYKIKVERLSRKYEIFIKPNTIGKGLYIPHLMGGIIINARKLGTNCSINAGAVVGHCNGGCPEIGDNVEIGLGCKIYGNIKIGNNVIITPNSVIYQDVPDNVIIGGNPPKIIKYK